MCKPKESVKVVIKKIKISIVYLNFKPVMLIN